MIDKPVHVINEIEKIVPGSKKDLFEFRTQSVHHGRAIKVLGRGRGFCTLKEILLEYTLKRARIVNLGNILRSIFKEPRMNFMTQVPPIRPSTALNATQGSGGRLHRLGVGRRWRGRWVSKESDSDLVT